MWDTVAFLGTDQCLPNQERNAAVGQGAVILGVVLVIGLLTKFVLTKQKPLWQKFLAVVLCIGAVVAGMIGIMIIAIGGACSG